MITTERTSQRAMAIVERYEGAINYLYPMLLNMSHKHRVLRDEALRTLLAQLGLFHDAAKSGQASRLYLADAGLATIRGFLRLLADPSRKLLSRRQYEVASVHLASWRGHAKWANTHNLLQRLEVAV